MLYAQRDPEGRIIAVTRDAAPGAEPITADLEAEVAAFLERSGQGTDPRALLGATDASLIRAIEDLVQLLIEKKVICFTDLPLEVQQKINTRRKIRRKLAGETLMVDDIL